MSNIRKDSFVVHASANGPVYGRVLSVKRDGYIVTTDAGESAKLPRDATTTKITVGEYKANAGKTAETFAKVDAPNPAPVAELGTESVTAPERTTTRPGGERRPGAKGTGKKAAALSVWANLVAASGDTPTRKAFTVAMSNAGLSAKGASTYYYNIKNGKWA